MKKYKTSDFKRDKREEDKAVKYWFYEKKGDILISLVAQSEYNNPEVRVSGTKIDNFRIPMSESKFETIPDKEVLRVAVNRLNMRIKK